MAGPYVGRFQHRSLGHCPRRLNCRSNHWWHLADLPVGHWPNCLALIGCWFGQTWNPALRCRPTWSFHPARPAGRIVRQIVRPTAHLNRPTLNHCLTRRTFPRTARRVGRRTAHRVGRSQTVANSVRFVSRFAGLPSLGLGAAGLEDDWTDLAAMADSVAGAAGRHPCCSAGRQAEAGSLRRVPVATLDLSVVVWNSRQRAGWNFRSMIAPIQGQCLRTCCSRQNFAVVPNVPAIAESVPHRWLICPAARQLKAHCRIRFLARCLTDRTDFPGHWRNCFPLLLLCRRQISVTRLTRLLAQRGCRTIRCPTCRWIGRRQIDC